MLNIVWLIGFFVWQGWCGRWRGCTTSWSLSAGFYLWHCRRRRSAEFQHAPGDCLILPSTEASCPALAGSSTLCSSQLSPSSGVRVSEAASKSWVKNQERKGQYEKPDLFTFLDIGFQHFITFSDIVLETKNRISLSKLK